MTAAAQVNARKSRDRPWIHSRAASIIFPLR